MRENEKIKKSIDMLEKPSKHIKCVHKCENGMEFFSYSSDLVLAFETAINGLKELEQYRSIGTVEECWEAVERQKAKIPDVYGDGYSDGQLVYDMYSCPNCGESYEIDYDHYDYCPNCGQHMDKSGEVFE